MNKKITLIIICVILIQQSIFAETTTFSDKNKFGLKDTLGNVTVNAKYKKLIRLGETGWIMQDGNKFGIIDDNGNILIEPKYNRAERILGKFVKFRKGDKYGIFDEKGLTILPVEYSSIDLLYGGMFVTSKNYKYGISDFSGNIILENIFDDIYMPDFNTLTVVYNGKAIEIKREQGTDLELPYDILNADSKAMDFNFSDITDSPLASTGYYSVTFTDYILKIFSSISPSYEETIDELMLSQGADTVSILMKFSWLPRFPFVYAKNYYKYLIAPYNGPLSNTKKNLRQQIKG